MTQGSGAGDLFGEPERKAELSQFFTPMWLARRAAAWACNDRRVLEPSAGRGNLARAWVEDAWPGQSITLVEKDERWIPSLRLEFENVIHADFLQWSSEGAFDAALMNPPYENGQDAEHVAHALSMCACAVAIVKSDFEFSAERDRVLWRRARVVRRAILVDRPQFGSTATTNSSASRNYVVLKIVPADVVGCAYQVTEERWRKPGAKG